MEKLSEEVSGNLSIGFLFQFLAYLIVIVILMMLFLIVRKINEKDSGLGF